MEKALIREGIDRADKTLEDLADFMHVSLTTAHGITTGPRRLRVDELPKLRKFIGLDRIPLKGYVGIDNAVSLLPFEDKEFVRIRAPIDADFSTAALEFTPSSQAALLNGSVAYFQHIETKLTPDLVTKTFVVVYPDGKMVLKRVDRADLKAKFGYQINGYGEKA